MEYTLEIKDLYNETILYCVREDYSDVMKEINSFLRRQTDNDDFTIQVKYKIKGE